MLRKLHIATLVLSASLIAGALSLAANAADTRSVQTSDLNLDSEAGRALLRQRVDNAVREVCDVSGWGFDLRAQRAYDSCRSKALAPAMRQADALVQAARNNHMAANRSVPASMQ